MSTRSSPRVDASQRGVSIIEILVGVAIGLIGVIAMFQVVGIWDRHTQTTSAGGDAQVAGTLALFNLERDFKQSGHGFGEAPLAVMGCVVNGFDRTGRGVFSFPLRPIDIVVGASGAPDQINVVAGNSSFFVEGQDFLSAVPPTSKQLRRRGGFKQGDLVVIADAGGALPGSANCTLAEISADNDPDLVTVSHVSAGYTPFGSVTPRTTRFDAAQAVPAVAYLGGTLFNLGPAPQIVSWQIANNRSLTRTDFLAAGAAGTSLLAPGPGETIADGAINLKAEFLVDLNNNTQVDAGEWLPAVPPGVSWKRVLAIRVALLVRSRHFERSRDSDSTLAKAVTPVAPTYFGGSFVMTNVNGGSDAFTGAAADTPDPNNWRFYRYRVYERIIPLKNMLWAVP